MFRVLDSRGFTLPELMVAALSGMIVIATLYGFYRGQLFNLLAQETKTATMEDARGSLEMMVRELRNAGSWALGTPPSACARIESASATQIQIRADLDGNNDCTSATGDDVTYAYVPTSTSTCPGARVTRNNDCLVANVVIPSGSYFLTYYPSGSATPYCFSTGNPSGCSGDLLSNLANVKRVKITVTVRVGNPNPDARTSNPHITTTLSSSVMIRN